MSKASKPLILGVGGTTRAGSTSEQALRLALAAAERMGAETQLFSGAALNFPVYEPGNPTRSMAAIAFVGSLRRADGIIVATPSYHGSISGFVKNALDYVEDMRDDPNPYFDGRSVGCIVCADGAQSLGSTLATLRSIVHALRGWPTPFAAAINARPNPFKANGRSAPIEVTRSLDLVAQQVVEFAQMRRYYEEARAQEVGADGRPVLAAGERWPRQPDDAEADLTTIYGFINW